MNISKIRKHHLILFGILKDLVHKRNFFTFYVFIVYFFLLYFSLEQTWYSQAGLTGLTYHPGFLLISYDTCHGLLQIENVQHVKSILNL